MKTNKKCVIGLLAATFALSLGIGVATVNTAMAEETAATFEMVAGASVRTDNPSGIRFTTVVNDAYKATLSAEYDYPLSLQATRGDSLLRQRNPLQIHQLSFAPF